MRIKEIVELINETSKPVISILSKGHNSKLIALGLGHGAVLKEHKAPGPTRLVMLKGEIEYRSKRGVKVFKALDEFQIPLEEIHSVKGAEESVFLLSVNH